MSDTVEKDPLPTHSAGGRVTVANALMAVEAMIAGNAAVESGRARTVARLLRYAVETTADNYWETIRPGEVVGHAGRGHQLRLLAATLDRRTAHDVYATWCMLSDATKPHPYELAPTVGELRALQAAAMRAVTALDPGAPDVRTERATGSSSTSRTGTAPAA
jgi:hypothetical protein